MKEDTLNNNQAPPPSGGGQRKEQDVHSTRNTNHRIADLDSSRSIPTHQRTVTMKPLPSSEGGVFVCALSSRTDQALRRR